MLSALPSVDKFVVEALVPFAFTFEIQLAP